MMVVDPVLVTVEAPRTAKLCADPSEIDEANPAVGMHRSEAASVSTTMSRFVVLSGGVMLVIRS